MCGIRFFNLQPVLENEHLLLLVFIRKCLKINAVFPQKSTESGPLYILIGLMRRIELHNGMVLIFHAKTRHALSSIYIIAPARNTLNPGNSRQKTGKC